MPRVHFLFHIMKSLFNFEFFPIHAYVPMTITRKKLIPLLAVAIAATGALNFAKPSQAETAYARPTAPLGVTITPQVGGILVSWKAPEASPSITGYQVSTGAGGCGMTVSGKVTQAFIPSVAGQGSASGNVTVTAFNSLGAGDVASAAILSAPKVESGVRLFDADGRSNVWGAGTDLQLPSGSGTVLAAASTKDGRGYWAVLKSGRVLPMGNALNIDAQSDATTVSILPSVDDKGFTLINKKGQVTSYGSATLKSAASKVTSPVVAGVAASTGLYLVHQNGTIEAIAGAPKISSLKATIVAATGSRVGNGGWALTSTGSVAAFGSAPQISGKVANGVALNVYASNAGLYVADSSGFITALGDAPQVISTTMGKKARVLIPSTPSYLANSVSIDYFSDFHGAIQVPTSKIGGAANLATYFANDKSKTAVITAAGGDNFGAAPPISSQFEEIPAVKAENMMGLDVTALGNHEHDRDSVHLNKMMDLSTFEWVGSNYTNASAFKKLKPYTIIERGGVKVGFVGTTTLETMAITPPANLAGATITDPAPAAQKAIDDVRKAGADFVVSINHIGYSNDSADKAVGDLIDFAGALKGADLVYGGHTHLKWAGLVNGTLVQEVPNAGVLYSRTQICFDKATKALIGTSQDFVVPDGNKVDPNADVAAMVKTYEDQMAAKFDTKIATITNVFPHGGSPQIQRVGESAIGDYFSDIVRKKYNTDFALLNGGGIRANLPALTYTPQDKTLRRPKAATDLGTFDLTLGDVYTVFPFGNNVSTTKITGKTVWSFLENGVSQVESGAGRFPVVSGLKFEFTASAPLGQRVKSVTMTDGTPILNDTSKTYTLATIDYMILGGDGYTQFDPLKSTLRDLLAQVIVDELTARGTITVPALDGRIKKNA
jgi:2',3'-cyclic-nucleotide 2'-phosphodiesterase (5'-nucleotidase family)